MDFKTLLKKEFIILDGAMGTMLQNSGLRVGAIPELLSITDADKIVDIHRQYVLAGADIIYANTFGANEEKLRDCKYSVGEVVGASIANAKKACEGTDALVALDIGPTGQMLLPSGTMSFERAYEVFAQQIKAGENADVIVIETMTQLGEIRAAVLAAKENSDKPIICTMTFEKNMRTFTGCSIPAMAQTLQGLGVDAIGINCSLGPDDLAPIVEQLSKWTDLPIVVKPNAGLPDPNSNTYDVSAQDFSKSIEKLVPLGIKIAGGCCGTTPEYIKLLKQTLASKKYIKQNYEIPSAVCSSSKIVEINCPRIIGERINPTGKKRFKQALLENDIDYILSQALQQVSAGADILDVNVGLPQIDESEMLTRTVSALQEIVDTPLQIDSSDPKAIESALRIYQGKAIVNSVNGEQKSIDTILPIVAKYGAAVVGLTLDEKGIPQTAQQRVEIAQRILDAAQKYGIPKRDVYIDCLTLTASAQQDQATQTLQALNIVKNQMGLKTVLGVSNISFGLPSREIVNSTFLTMAMQNGLDLPIINPNADAMTGAVRAFRLLTNADENCVEYIYAYGTKTEQAPQSQASPSDITLFDAVVKGLKGDAQRITKELLQTCDVMQIINEILIPALDVVGDGFEKGTLFLPQLIQSAKSAQVAFEEIKVKLINADMAPVSKGKIVLATVKGDIHDIGKNIVKVLLENYGYTVIDLGNNVEPQAVLDAVQNHGAKLVGLSALMTTTLVNMEQTIKLLKDNNADCKTVVGGAVLTPEYASSIGADYYAKDAKESVDVAKKVFI
ncbi:MAG: homocysteine methyltransferase [Clostridia bacterium]|nr:homocysteine methyltransferase [Clostridia bacterium]